MDKLSPDDYLAMSPEQALQNFKETLELIKNLVRPYMATKEGRDQIRRTFGCKIEGCEEEEKGFVWIQNAFYSDPSWPKSTQ